MKRILYPMLTLVLALTSLASFSQTYTLFGSSAPANPDDSNPQDIEVGTKFYVTQAGQITHLRFHRGSNNTGTFIGHLWLDNENGTGSILATESFTYTIPGWVEVALATPVTITPGNLYVVSYYSPNGSYGSTENIFNTGSSVGADPLWAIDRTADPTYPATGGNGVYFFNPPDGVGGFPTTYFSDAGTNYYADVIFELFFPLPVSLTDFKAVTNNKNIDVTWKTQNESNNKGFEIQRSNDNTNWYTIAFVPGAGNSTVSRNYTYTDKELASGKYYYRLRQIDIDSRVKLSSTVLASITGRGQTSLFQNAPNPVRAGGYTTIRFDLPEDQRTRISVLDLTGREVKLVLDKTAQQGSHIISFDVSGLSKQMYIIRMQTTNEVITRKMLIQ